ncbi:MAG: Gfo/Idh/MocA family oxidoreductase [Planctomycetota bacterium]|nr:Gfo/Idh/MocA family oxidoreductase [Planctomycetota bacterium]
MAAPLRIGMIGLDTSHVTAFAKLLNDPTDPHHVKGGKVVVAFPGGSRDFGLSWNRVEKFTKDLKDAYGIQVVDSPEAVAQNCDLVLLESVDGRVHLEQFRRIAPFKKPTFIDKPLAVTSADAREIFRLAQDSGTTVMTSSSLRYADNLTATLTKAPADAGGAIVGCEAFGPMSIEPTQPGLFWYGIHTVEVISAVMGPGCKQVVAASNNDFDIVTGTWADGRMAVLRGHRKGHSKFGVTIHREQSFEILDLYANARPLYAAMLESIMANLPKGVSPIPAANSIEIIRFIEAANESRGSGKPVTL